MWSVTVELNKLQAADGKWRMLAEWHDIAVLAVSSCAFGVYFYKSHEKETVGPQLRAL